MEENDNMEYNESETASNGLQMFDEMVSTKNKRCNKIR